MIGKTSPQIKAKIVKSDNIPLKNGLEMRESNIQKLL